MRIRKDSWLLTRPIAHRGLWGKGIAENTRKAYKNAVDNGYPIEIDLFGTTDGVVVSFHDDSLLRMTGAEGNIFDKSYDELKQLKIIGSDETIPTFNEVLETIDGKVPVLIELKNQPDNSYIETVIKTLKNYRGEFAIQAFDPLYLNKVKKLAPDFLRGILATDQAKHLPFIKRFIVKNMSLNFLCKPDFISYIYSGLPLCKCKTKNKAVLAWTLTDQKTANEIKPFCDNIIFENFIPE